MHNIRPKFNTVTKINNYDADFHIMGCYYSMGTDDDRWSHYFQVLGVRCFHGRTITY